ncbi:putative transcriptional regulatory protein [Oceanicola granulosus HTCC2516]|uniref:Putative transcriptional regulatory protein n=1 Tax=Oceanicola granulosus (strain ATCC BAA-861 / DSM 15982 / KCTC 12143 / HTCC2516) TaxID=314256 RepID=Q2CJ88_OCEGH|nr:sugar-binding transcriptional regulator [Oceanicola granulosus]EAR52712.1 putative transcriptional regulatory protein [Oceanicola granulosus HTCC2516]
MPASGRRARGEVQSRTEQQIIEAAWCYFKDDMSQADIAARLGLSRSTVVNYLALARARGYVRVSLHPEIFRQREIAEELKRKFALKDALVVPGQPDDPAADLLRVARAAADWLPELLTAGDRLGVSWGETVYHISTEVEAIAIPGLDIVQLVGSRATPLGFAAETCSANLATAFSANCINLHAPLLVQSSDLAEMLRREPVIAAQLDAIRTCNKVLFAAGSVGSDSHVVRSGVVSEATLAAYQARGAAAVICGRFIDRDGNPIPGEIDARIIGTTIDEMRGKELGLLAAAGADKTEPTRAALRAGFTTHLVTCSEIAAGLLADD